MTKQFTNAQIIGFMNALGGDSGLIKKEMPVKILYAIHRSAPNIEAAYKAYDETLTDICNQYGVTRDNLQTGDAKKQKELNEHISDLLNTEVEVDIHCIDECVLEDYDDTRFEPLTYTEVDVLYAMLVKEVNECEH